MAVYTPLTLGEAREHVGAHYAIGRPIACTGIAQGVDNSNFLLETDRAKYILTIFERRAESGDLPAILDHMGRLSRSGVPCPVPVADACGRTLLACKGKPSAIFTFLEGRSVAEITPAHMRGLGEMMARMHGVYSPALPPNRLSLAGWQEIAAAIASRLDGIEPGLRRLVEDELEFQENHRPTGLREGVIHGDIFPDNVFFGGGDEVRLTGIIDFYFACTDSLAFDLAITLNAWCFKEDNTLDTRLSCELLWGYHAALPLSDAEIEALPILARGAALRFLLTRANDMLNPVPGAIVTPKDPLEFARKLQALRSVGDATEYGV